MSFFKREHKKLASCSYGVLNKCYHVSERNLKFAVASGDENKMRDAMSRHQLFEYAMLYRNSPEFKQQQNQLIQSCSNYKNNQKKTSKQNDKRWG